MMRTDMAEPAALHELIRKFLDYELPEIQEFREARQQFKTDLPAVLERLRETVLRGRVWKSGVPRSGEDIPRTLPPVNWPRRVERPRQGDADPAYSDQGHFPEGVRRGPVSPGEQRRPPVGRPRTYTFFTGDVRRQAIDRLRSYYGAIGRVADDIAGYGEKQQFIKGVYEDFYQAYNPGAADRLGVVYTPNEVVDFIIRGTDWLLQKHFGKTLADDNVNILDPATGTGTFITNLISHLPADRLEYKYLNEISRQRGGDSPLLHRQPEH